MRMDVLRGRAPAIEVALLADDDVRGRTGERALLKAFHACRGLPDDYRWIPPGSFEDRTSMWWPPKGCLPRILDGEPPVL